MPHVFTCKKFIWLRNGSKIVCKSFKSIKKLSKFKECSFAEDFIKNYNENSNKGYILEFEVEYPKNLFNLHSDLPFLARINKIKKYKKLACFLHKSFKTSIKSWFNTIKIHTVIQFSREGWLKTYIDMNTKLRPEAKTDFEKDFFKLMNNAVFGTTMENVRKHIELVY